MYDPDYQPIKKPLQTAKLNDSMYKYCKHMLYYISDWTRLPEKQRKHYTDYKEFVELWEAGQIHRWQDFFKIGGETAKI